MKYAMSWSYACDSDMPLTLLHGVTLSEQTEHALSLLISSMQIDITIRAFLY